jgi:hypothetical protein
MGGLWRKFQTKIGGCMSSSNREARKSTITIQHRYRIDALGIDALGIVAKPASAPSFLQRQTPFFNLNHLASKTKTVVLKRNFF